jgi:WD40 repeat protein/transcriptional regulator with XRE-family HTH domain
MNPEQTFGRFVRQRRRELDLTQEELARRVGCAAITIRKIEADDARPSVQIAERLAMALAIPLDDRAEFVRRAREARPEAPLPVETPMPAPEEIGREDLTGRAIRGYALAEKIGAGGMGAVYRATQPLVEREVAVKIILPAFANHPDFIRRFEAEAQLVARLEHPHIVPLYDYWREPGVAYLVMRLLRGGSVQGLLGSGPLPIVSVARLLEQICLALHSAHRIGVIHRDLKPGNVLLDEDQNAYLADFGIAKNLGNPNLEDATQVDGIVGSPAYISPEQIRSLSVRPQTDIYCLGVMLYEMLTGALPFTGPTPFDLLQQHITAPLPSLAAHRAGLPAALDAVIARAAAKDPDDRYPDVLALLDDFRRALSGLAAQAVFIPAPEEEEAVTELVNPYKGLRAFGEADADDFFGRETLTQQLLARLSEGGELARFLAVVGPSGSGKSSVVGAGLVPALRRGGLLGSENWFYVDLLPGPRPFEELEAALLRVAVNPPASLLEQLKSDSRGLLRAVNRILPADETIELVLVVDQFEELFTLTSDEAERALFLSSLVAAIMDERSRVRVVATLRADFIDRPLRYVDFGELLQRRNELILPLTPDELERAILGPARRVGLKLESGLVSAIVRDVGDQPGALPLLQYALTELFEKREGRTLTKAAYDSIGGVLGALGRRAEEVFASLDETGQEAARQLFLRLVTLGEGTEDTRRRVLRAELEGLTVDDRPQTADGRQRSAVGGQWSAVSGRVSAVIDAFGKHRLLAFDRDPITRGPTVEVAHEALLREWPRLREWLNESRADVRLQRQLAQAAHDWQVANRDVSFLLTGARLAQFEGWAANTSVALTHDERAFLEASIAERDRSEAEERERQRRELETVRKLAETEKAKAENERRDAMRLRIRNRVIAAAGVVALVLAVLAGLFGLQSSQNATRAEQNLGAAQIANTQSASNAALAQANAATAQVAAETRATAEAIAVQERADAQQQALIASVRELAGAANLNLDVDPERSILLALEAVKLTSNVDQPPLLEAQDALHRAVQASRLQFTLRGHTAEIMGLAYSPDGVRLATIADDNTVKIWDIATGAELISLPTGEMAPNVYRSLSFSPDGKHLAASAAPHLAKVWDANAASGQELLTLSGHTDEVTAAIFSPDGKQIATASLDQTTKIWDAATGQELLTLTGQNDAVDDVAFSPDGAYLATAGETTGAIIWEIASGQALFTLPVSGGVNSVAFSPDGKTLATGASNTSWSLWDVSTGQRLFTGFGHASLLVDIAFDAGGTRVVTANEDGTAKIWEAATGRELLTLRGHASGALGAVFSPDGRHVATASRDTTVKIWDVSPAGGGEWLNLVGHTDRVFGVAYSPDGQRIATASYDGTARIWDAATGKELFTLTDPDYAIRDVGFTPDSTRLVTASQANFDDEGLSTVSIWDAATGQRLLSISGRFYGDVSSNPDGKTFATDMMDGTVKLWEVATGKETMTLTGNASLIQDLAYSPDGKRLAAAPEDGAAKIWDTATGQLALTLAGDVRLNGVAFNHDGKLIATAGNDATIKIWDAATGELLYTLTGHNGPTFGVAFSPDDRYLATTSVDGTIKIWNVADNFTSLPLTLYGHTRAVFRVAFSPDGARLVTTSRDATARVYAATIDDLIALAQSRLTRTLAEQECQQYLHVAACPGD